MPKKEKNIYLYNREKSKGNSFIGFNIFIENKIK